MPGASPKRSLVLFGPPGSGKGTQANLIKTRLEIPHISTGDMLREHIELGDELGLLVRSVLKLGNLVSDELVNRLVVDRIGRDDCKNGFSLDGYPRTVPQAEYMCELLGERGFCWTVIHLAVDYNKITKRLSGRRQCPLCGTLYNLSSKPPKLPGFCDGDGTKLVIREDDKESVIRQRLEGYERQTRPILEFFSQQPGVLHQLNASDDPPEKIAQAIVDIVKNQRVHAQA